MAEETSFPFDDESGGLREPQFPGIHLEAISEHLDEFLDGERVEYHEIISDVVHVDILHINPSERFPFHTLVTSGMSELPMNAPESAQSFRRAELLMHLPPEWPLSTEAFEDPNHYWPIEWLKTLARYPHEHETFLAGGHTIASGSPGETLENTPFNGFILWLPNYLPEDFFALELEDETLIAFWQVIPIYQDEMELVQKKGAHALMDQLVLAGGAGPVNIHRPSCLPKRKRFGIF